MNNHGFVKVATVVPKIQVGNPEFNSKEIKNLIEKSIIENPKVMVFPELCLSGYTCGDLFFQKQLIESCKYELNNICNFTKKIDSLILLGIPLDLNGQLYNCAVITQKGNILGIVPKKYLPNYKEFYEKRWFSSGLSLTNDVIKIDISGLGKKIPVGNILFNSKELGFSLGIEICEDLWAPIPQSSYLTLQGANIIANLSASNELIGKSEYRHNLITNQSARCICGYIYTSSGVYESTTDLVFSGDSLIVENGTILKEGERFCRNSIINYSEIDVERLNQERMINKTFADCINSTKLNEIHKVNVHYNTNCENINSFSRKIEKYPFVPNDISLLNKRSKEIFDIQVTGLCKRLEHTNCKDVVIGVSGGLDSTLALLVSHKAFEKLNLPFENIHGITMPGFGTSDKTHSISLKLMKELGVSLSEISIFNACVQHFDDIKHDINVHDIVYENVQARERTQILMDLANKYNGLVIGTGDLSELALGWCTYNGDHMSMYAVNSGVPKTLVKFMIKTLANEGQYKILNEILNLPISPELLPPDLNGRITQNTEDKIGPYELHDFFLYYTIKYGFKPEKILFLAEKAFKDEYDLDIIKKWYSFFLKRFFSQQFKRSCIPDGVKVGSISLSPRGDWRMPSDADVNIWLKNLN